MWVVVWTCGSLAPLYINTHMNADLREDQGQPGPEAPRPVPAGACRMLCLVLLCWGCVVSKPSSWTLAPRMMLYWDRVVLRLDRVGPSSLPPCLNIIFVYIHSRTARHTGADGHPGRDDGRGGADGPRPRAVSPFVSDMYKETSYDYWSSSRSIDTVWVPYVCINIVLVCVCCRSERPHTIRLCIHAAYRVVLVETLYCWLLD